MGNSKKVKTCKKCKTDKPLSAFSKKSSNADGLRAWCKACDKKRLQKTRAEYTKINKNKIWTDIDVGYCYICKETKPHTDFRKNSSKKSGLNNFCEHCRFSPKMLLDATVQSAKRRGYDCNLDESFISENIYKKPCSYCGISDGKTGIDREDNNIGYLKKNCIPCCGPCNQLKHALDKNLFIEHCRRVAIHNFGEKVIILK